ncbi:ran binding protein 11 [Cantharellus anzutake]|uniref:ran binding protein 11 n=1 Tax=Cantharellus anzutake TaxID=1750568 RepID=UPI001903E9F4|nr:ran binding protein 11 [Cantharellus anzutake]KAF8341568.1 ran binding protein 11 [Cantharellus anzutake]
MNVFEALRDAVSQDPSRAASSLGRLQEIQKTPSALAKMIQISSDKTVPLDIRRMAIIQFKNHGTPNWRSKILFTPEDRIAVRQTCATFLEENDDTVAQCSAVIISKLYRIDGLTAWPQLLPGLISVIQGGVKSRFSTHAPNPTISLSIKRTVAVLNQVLKELASLKIPGGVQFMGQVVTEIHPLLKSIYGQYATQLSTAISPTSINEPQVAADVEVAHYTYKCLSKVILWAWNRSGAKDVDKQEIDSFFSSSAPQLRVVFNLRVNLVLALRSRPSAHPDAVGLKSIQYLTKHLKAFGKLFRKMQQSAVPRFLALPECAPLIMYYWNKVIEANSLDPSAIGESPDSVYPAPVLLQGMVLLKDALGQWSPSHQNLLSKEWVEEAVGLILLRFLPLKVPDLEKWQGDSEEWINDEDRDTEAWEFDIRPCAERIIMTMTNRMPEYVIPILLKELERAYGAQNPEDLQAILRREALYCAMGRCLTWKESSFNLGQWINGPFSANVSQTSPSYRILKRRIAWVLGEFGHAGTVPPFHMQKFWEMVTYLLRDRSESSDAAVRLTACQAIRSSVDSLNFDAATFSLHLPQVISGLMALLPEMDTIESKTRIATSLNNVIETNGAQIEPFINIITDPIPGLWLNSEQNALFQAALLDLAKQLVQASKNSVPLLHIVIPLIQESMMAENRLRLDEDGLALWLTSLRHASSVLPTAPNSPSFIDLLPGAVQLLGENLDLLGSILSIIESYLLLDAASVLKSSAAELHSAYLQSVKSANGVNVKDVIDIINIMIQVAPSGLWAEAMHSSGLFDYMLNSVVRDKGNDRLLIEEFHVFARIIIQDVTIFLRLVDAAQARTNGNIDLFDKLLDQWWRKFDSMAEPQHRKLTAMAMARLVATGRPAALKRMSGETFNLWLDVLGEMKEAIAAEDENHLHLYWKQNGGTIPDRLLKDSEGSLEEGRRKALYANDPVQATLLTAYITAQLQEAPRNAPTGPDSFNAHLAKADPLVLDQLKKALM